MNRQRISASLFTVMLCAPLLAQISKAPRLSSNEAPAQLRNVHIDQKLNAQVPLDVQFQNDRGETVTMRQLLGKRPAILNFVYYGCPRLCSMTLNGLSAAIKVIPFNVGQEFDIITVSFDTRETPELAAKKKAIYLRQYGREGSAPGWHFLTGKRKDIERLTGAVGFGFEYDPKIDQFAHASGIMVLTPSGRVSKYYYGIEYSARDLRLGLVDAAARKIGSPVDQVLLYCFHYDPSTGKYSMAIMNTIRTAGAATLLLIIGFVSLHITRDGKRKREQQRSAA